MRNLPYLPAFVSGHGGENDKEVRQALLIRKITTPEATIVVLTAGTIPYFSDRYSMDELGKTDSHIANKPVKQVPGRNKFIGFQPGHMKYDFDDSIGQLKPDMVVQVWEPIEGVPTKLEDLDKYYKGVRLLGECVYLRADSVNVVWANVPTVNCP